MRWLICKSKMKMSGFSLIEMLLVLVIVGVLILTVGNYMQLRMDQMKTDKASIQMQQILNAGLAYYVNVGSWPQTIACLQGDTADGADCTVRYLPDPITSPFGDVYRVKGAAGNGPFYVWTKIPAGTTAAAKAKTIAGVLPLGYDSTTGGSPPSTGNPCTVGVAAACRVVSSVNVPAQAFDNNRGYLNFAGLYRNGGCVPVPTCPNNTTPQVFVMPVQITGSVTNDNYAYPISSFTAYARGPAAPGAVPACYNSVARACTDAGVTAAQYWRVCGSYSTQVGGDVAPDWALRSSFVAVTRCSPNTESRGSAFSVYTD